MKFRMTGDQEFTEEAGRILQDQWVHLELLPSFTVTTLRTGDFFGTAEAHDVIAKAVPDIEDALRIDNSSGGGIGIADTYGHVLAAWLYGDPIKWNYPFLQILIAKLDMAAIAAQFAIETTRELIADYPQLLRPYHTKFAGGVTNWRVVGLVAAVTGFSERKDEESADGVLKEAAPVAKAKRDAWLKDHKRDEACFFNERLTDEEWKAAQAANLMTRLSADQAEQQTAVDEHGGGTTAN